MNQEVTNEFKINAQKIAFNAFLTICKKYKMYFQVLFAMSKAVGIEKRNLDFTKWDSMNFFYSHSPKIDVRRQILLMMQEHIERNFANMSRNQTQYDYLVHCVNTYIQVFIEQDLYANKSTYHLTKGLPRFEEMGEQIFNLAAKKLFGSDFKNVENNNTLMPQTEEEEIYIRDCIRSLRDRGYTLTPPQIQELITNLLMDLRRQQMNNSIKPKMSVLDGCTYSQDDFDYNNDECDFEIENDFEEEEDDEFEF